VTYGNAAERKANYLQKAEEARQNADNASDEASRNEWLVMAAKWQALAETTTMARF
jgi:hypothetical protein